MEFIILPRIWRGGKDRREEIWTRSTVNARADPRGDHQDFRIDQLSGVWEPSGPVSSVRPSDQNQKIRCWSLRKPVILLKRGPRLRETGFPFFPVCSLSFQDHQIWRRIAKPSGSKTRYSPWETNDAAKYRQIFFSRLINTTWLCYPPVKNSLPLNIHTYEEYTRKQLSIYTHEFTQVKILALFFGLNFLISAYFKRACV